MADDALKKIVDAAFDDDEEEDALNDAVKTAFDDDDDLDSAIEKSLGKSDENNTEVKTKQRNGMIKKQKPEVIEKKRKARRPRKRWRYRPGTLCLKEIKKYQKSFELLTPRSVMCRTIRRHTQNYSMDTRLERGTVEAIQEIVEAELIKFAEGSQELAISADRVTVTGEDARVYRKIRFGETT